MTFPLNHYNIHINGSKRFKRSAAVKVGKLTKTEFERWLDAPQKAQASELETIYAKAISQTSGAAK